MGPRGEGCGSRFIAKDIDVAMQAECRGRTSCCDRTLDRGCDCGRFLRSLGDKEDAPSLQDCRYAHCDRTFGNRRRIGKIDGIRDAGGFVESDLAGT